MIDSENDTKLFIRLAVILLFASCNKCNRYIINKYITFEYDKFIGHDYIKVEVKNYYKEYDWVLYRITLADAKPPMSAQSSMDTSDDSATQDHVDQSTTTTTLPATNMVTSPIF